MESLEAPTVPLTPAQRRLVLATAVAVALTRLLAVSRTLWDWDEVQFALAVREYDAADYRPHPPGFPLFILLARLVRPLAANDFRAVQTVSVIAAMALFPVVFFLCRELRFSFASAYAGAVLTAFLPNVWFYGGTAFSDIPSLALTLGGCAFLLRGVRERRAMFIGALLLALAAAIRPQALIVGCAPGLIVLWKRRRAWRDILGAIALGAGVIAIAYTGAALASSSIADYVDAGRRLRQYLREVDSFLADSRPPLRVLAPFFFVKAIPGGMLARTLIIGGIAGLVLCTIRREGRPWLLVAMLLPFQIFAWLMLDYHSVTRYGVSFAPMYAILAAAGVVSATSLVPRGSIAGMAIVLMFAATLAAWAMPALSEVRRNPSPPVLAMEWINRVVPRGTMTFIHGSVIPYARYFLGEREMTIVETPRDTGNRPASAGSVLVTELPSAAISASRFVRGRGRLFDMVRERYFEMTVLPAHAWAEFGEGWHDTEWHSEVVWLWMGRRSVTWLPPLEGGRASLALRLEPVPEKGPPVIEVHLNGRLVERFQASGLIEKSWTVDARGDGWNELVITSDRAVNPAKEGLGDDTRDLAIQLHGYDWGPAAR